MMAQRSRVTVVVPTYNVGRYIHRCLGSILTQTHENIEIIVVDDGSTDDTTAQVRLVAARDLRLQLLEQPANAGAHAARNRGVTMATGDFVCFVDGDDWIGPRMVERLLHAVCRSAAQISFCGATVSTGDRDVGPKVQFKRQRVYEENILLRFCLLEFGSGVVWNKLYRTELIRREMERPWPGRVDSGEDYILNFGCFAQANRVAALPENHYFYFQRHDSVSRAQRPAGNFVATLKAYLACLEIHGATSQDHAALVDLLFTRQLAMPSYRVEELVHLAPHRSELADCIQRLSIVHPAGLHALIHTFDPHVSMGPLRLRPAVRRLISAAKDTKAAALSRLSLIRNATEG